MSKGVVICRAEDDCGHAMDGMSRHQVRRVPVVDAEGALIGIISQADIARQSSQEETGEVLENISRPRGLTHTIRTRMTPQSSRHSVQSAFAPGVVPARNGLPELRGRNHVLAGSESRSKPSSQSSEQDGRLI